MTHPFSVIIVDDEPVVLDALQALLGDEPRLTILAVGHSGTDAVRLAAEHRPALAVLDLRMPGGGSDCIHGVLAASPQTRVVILSAYEDAVSVDEARRAGAVAFLAKGRLAEDLPEVLVRCASS